MIFHEYRVFLIYYIFFKVKLGQPGHSVINRLGISNFWNFNTIGIRQDRRNFINNFIIKKLIIIYFKFSNYFFFDLYHNNKWFNFTIKKTSSSLFWKLKACIYDFFGKRLYTNYYWSRLFKTNFYSTKIQIFRYEDWIIVSWFLYNKTTWRISNSIRTKKLFSKNRRFYWMSVSFTSLLYLKFFIILKLKKLKYSKTPNMDLIKYVNYKL